MYTTTINIYPRGNDIDATEMTLKFGENEICVLIEDPIIIHTTYYKTFSITINGVTHEEPLDYYQSEYNFVLLKGLKKYFLESKYVYDKYEY